MPAPLASWNPARDAWETSHSHIDLFSGLSAVWSETWPSWGMWADGVAYARPTSAHLTAGSASSSSPGLLPTPTVSDTNGAGAHGTGGPDLRSVAAMLPTPMANDWRGPNNQRRDDGRRQTTLADAASLLPTPTSRDHKGANQRGDETCLTGALLPTPKATDGTKGGPNQRGSSGDLTLPSAAMTLLPTPTAVPYGNNQSPSPGASVRPSLDTLAPMLLPTPTAMDSKASGGSTPSDVTLTDAVVRTRLGATTNPRFADGKAS